MTAPHRYPLLDLLRASAVSWVFLFHCQTSGLLSPGAALSRAIGWGHAGVDLFFVLSGFLIGRILAGEWERAGNIDVRRFWARRWLRTLPAYYAVLFLIRASDFWFRAKGNWGFFPSYLFFGQNYLVADPRRFGWSWSLCVEEQFYLLLPLWLLACRRVFSRVAPRRVLRLTGIGAWGFSVLARAWANPPIDAFASHLRLDGLGAGLILASLSERAFGSDSLGRAAQALGLLCVAGLVALGPSTGAAWYQVQQYFFLAIGFGAMVYGSLGPLGGRFPIGRPVRWVAEHSYGLYLLHPIVVRALEPRLAGAQWFGVMAAFIASLFASWVLRQAVELPALRWRDTRYA